MTTLEDIRGLQEWLSQDGWVAKRPEGASETCDWIWSKKMPGAPCHARAGEGIQVDVKIYSSQPPYEAEVALCGQRSDGRWVEILLYALPEGELATSVQKEIANILKIWETARGAMIGSQ